MRDPLGEMNMAEEKIWGSSSAINHRQVPSEGDDRKGFNFMPCLGGRIRMAYGRIVIVHFNSLKTLLILEAELWSFIVCEYCFSCCLFCFSFLTCALLSLCSNSILPFKEDSYFHSGSEVVLTGDPFIAGRWEERGGQEGQAGRSLQSGQSWWTRYTKQLFFFF